MTDRQAHTLLDQAQAFQDEGKLLHAVQLYTRLITSRPDLVAPFRRLAFLHAEQGWWASACRVLEESLVVHPDSDECRLLLGDVCTGCGRFDEAVSWYRSVRRRMGGGVAYRIGLVHMREGNWRAAESELRTALRLDPGQPEVHECLGEVLVHRRLFADAVTHLRASTRLDPYRASAHRLLGIALLGRYRLSEAFDEFALAVDTDPSDAEAWRLCADVLMRMHRFKEAEQYLTKALTLNPESPDATVSLGLLRLHRGDPGGAREAFDAVLRVQPGHGPALQGKLRLQLTRHIV